MNQSFYHYSGSLTTPPCTENTQYVVFQEVQLISFEDLANFNRFWAKNPNFKAAGGNSRSMQPINYRPVYHKLVTYN